MQPLERHGVPGKDRVIRQMVAREEEYYGASDLLQCFNSFSCDDCDRQGACCIQKERRAGRGGEGDVDGGLPGGVGADSGNVSESSDCQMEQQN